MIERLITLKVWKKFGHTAHSQALTNDKQLGVFADGVDRVRPTVIFKGKGLQVTTKEKERVLRQMC